MRARRLLHGTGRRPPCDAARIALAFAYLPPMRFYEYESKALFAKRGLPLAKSRIAMSAAGARAAAEEIGGPVVLKSQVLTGGRMKAGAVRFADTPDEAAAHFDAILPILVSG